ncbi:MAG: hypothetical protein JZU65_22325 [Chlorobium sp.]|nr:hypothetical protein [Chlorobium sp.]
MIISTEINDCQLALNALILEQFGPTEPIEPKPMVDDRFHRLGEIPDDELLEMIERGRGSEKFKKLFYEGDLSDYDNDHSAADLSLCNTLAFYTQKNPEQMDRLFRRSKLIRTKWYKKHSSDWRTYGKMTVEKAILGCQEVYQGAQSSGTAPVKRQGPIDPAQLLEAYAVGQEYVDKLGNERFLLPNLIIANHVVTIIAESGGGKTTFFFRHVAPELAKQGLKVWYIDADSPPSEHRDMKALADKYRF